MKLRIEQNTILKRAPIMAENLSSEEKISVKAGKEFEIEEVKRDRAGHWRVRISEPIDSRFPERYIWYAPVGHVKIVPSVEIPTSVKLEIPYKSQLDNQENPTGSCNVTSIAMCLEYLGTPRRPEYRDYPQFEDELYRYMLDSGLSRHEPQDLAQVVRDYGKSDRFTTTATIEELQIWLADGNPAVIHGYFTPFGHIMPAVGYDERGLIVHDPYGEWFSDGYRTDLSGAYLHYSYRLIRQTCIPDGDFWVHFIN